MSIQKMLLDLQDGNFVSLGYRVASYIALFFMGCSLHRVIRAKLGAMKCPRPSRPGLSLGVPETFSQTVIQNSVK
jgi:hypothetical protein